MTLHRAKYDKQSRKLQILERHSEREKSNREVEILLYYVVIDVKGLMSSIVIVMSKGLCQVVS